jgi:calmodulin
MQKLGQYPSDAELKVMIKRVDVNHDGSIDFNEFVQLMSLVSPSNPEKELWDAFNRIDADGSGYIDKDELKALMKSLGQKLTEEEIREMMKEVDSNGDGKIRFVTSPCIENYPITISLI